MHTIKPEKAEEIEDFKKLDALGKKHDIDPIKIAVAQIVLIMRNRFREMTDEAFEEFCNQGLEAVLPFAGLRMEELEPEITEEGWRSIPGWTKRKSRKQSAEDEPEFS